MPNADDEEFNTGSALPVAFTIDQGSFGVTPIDPYAGFAAGDSRISVNVRRPSWCMLQYVGSGVQQTFTKAITPGGDFAAWFRGDFNHRAAVAPVNNDMTLGMILTTDPFDINNNARIFINEADPGVLQIEFSKTVAGVATTIGTTADMPENQHWAFQGALIQVTAGNIHGWGLTETQAVYLGTSTFAPAIGRAGFIGSNAATTVPGNMIVGVDFLRFKPGTLFLP